jgi:hypothetical protein
MTDRKPPGVTFESWVDRQIREATERGDFDNLPGTGKPLPGLTEPHDENWWLKSYLRRHEVDTDPLLPPSIRLRREIERLPGLVGDLRAEDAVRDLVAELNVRVRESWRTATGPQPPLRLLNADAVVAQWRAARPVAAPETGPAESPGAGHADDVPAPRRWWRRIARQSR